MRLVILYKLKSDHERKVDDYLREFQYRSKFEPELIDADSSEGIGLAKLYDIVKYPAVLVMMDDGQLIKIWTDDNLPLIDEVVGYMMS